MQRDSYCISGKARYQLLACINETCQETLTLPRFHFNRVSAKARQASVRTIQILSSLVVLLASEYRHHVTVVSPCQSSLTVAEGSTTVQPGFLGRLCHPGQSNWQQCRPSSMLYVSVTRKVAGNSLLTLVTEKNSGVLPDTCNYFLGLASPTLEETMMHSIHAHGPPSPATRGTQCSHWPSRVVARPSSTGKIFSKNEANKELCASI
jgi:hypothetical protein